MLISHTDNNLDYENQRHKNYAQLSSTTHKGNMNALITERLNNFACKNEQKTNDKFKISISNVQCLKLTVKV